jgi:hypothetical protein
MTSKKPIVDVTLYLKGATLDPEVVSASLGVNGNVMRKKGETYRIGKSSKASSKIGLWTLESNSVDDSLSGKIAWLKNAIANKRVNPLEIPGVIHVDLDIYIELGRSADGDGTYSSIMKPDDIKWLHEIGADVSISLSFCQDNCE